jgi:hypothetical protein
VAARAVHISRYIIRQQRSVGRRYNIQQQRSVGRRYHHQWQQGLSTVRDIGDGKNRGCLLQETSANSESCQLAAAERSCRLQEATDGGISCPPAAAAIAVDCRRSSAAAEAVDCKRRRS